MSSPTTGGSFTFQLAIGTRTWPGDDDLQERWSTLWAEVVQILYFVYIDTVPSRNMWSCVFLQNLVFFLTSHQSASTVLQYPQVLCLSTKLGSFTGVFLFITLCTCSSWYIFTPLHLSEIQYFLVPVAERETQSQPKPVTTVQNDQLHLNYSSKILFTT